jgi:2,4-dienoyl-CoA reductase (NADPH2)
MDTPTKNPDPVPRPASARPDGAGLDRSSPAALPHLLRPGRIGTLELPHRMLMGSMHLGLEGPEADVERIAAFYAERARGGAALIITGGVAVCQEGIGEGAAYFVFGRPADEEALARVAEAVHAAGGRIAVQLFHAGRYARSAETGLRPVAPSQVPSRLNPQDPPRALRAEELPELAETFARAARRARELGFDAVEIMGSEGYLLNEFLAPATNRREDDWGGDAQRRMRFPLLVAECVRRALGREVPLLYRLSGADLVEGGTPWEDTLTFARRLEAIGVDALDVGVGWHESPVPTVGMLVPRAAFAAVAAGIRAAVRIPVIAANRINTPAVAERVLASGAADFVSLARPFLADPAFARKAAAGQAHRINVCIACNQACLDHVLGRPPRPASCLVNPAAGREREFVLQPVARARRLAVVGGGPAGLECARVLAARGHRVTLFECGRSLGGQLLHALRVPGKGEFAETLRYYREELSAAGVRVELGVAPEARELLAFDAVVVATGVRARVPDEAELPGVTLPHVVPYPDVFAGRVAVGERVAIVGGGGVACDLAHFLTEQGPASAEAACFLLEYGVLPPEQAVGALAARRQVTLMRRGPRIGPQLGPTTRWALLALLRHRGVRMLTGVRYLAITPEGVRIAREGREELVPADTVVLACGQLPEDHLAGELRGLGVPCRVIGGAREAAELDAKRAILEGALAGREL